MHKMYNERTFTDEALICKRCGWKGKGKATMQEHLFLTDATEIFCPECNHYIGFISHDDENENQHLYN